MQAWRSQSGGGSRSPLQSSSRMTTQMAVSQWYQTLGANAWCLACCSHSFTGQVHTRYMTVYIVAHTHASEGNMLIGMHV